MRWLSPRRLWICNHVLPALVFACLVVHCDDTDEKNAPIAATPPKTDDDPIGQLTLLPWPKQIESERGHLYLSETTRFITKEENSTAIEPFVEQLRRATGWPFEVTDTTAALGDIEIILDETASSSNPEHYDIEISKSGVQVHAPTEAGLFYATQTLRQLLPYEIESQILGQSPTLKLPLVNIHDEPRFGWRGTMLDVARHFFDVNTVKRQIDLAAMLKLNRFHIHLTDDQGWRMEIESWPNLTKIGAQSEVGGSKGGYYTKSELQEIIAYAQKRYITVIPEIDMPGHSNAALASYAELNESGQAADPYTGVEVGFSSLWVHGPKTEQFVQDVIREVAEITPGAWLHIGGDEAKVTSSEDYQYFMKLATQTVIEQNKEVIAWEEISRAELSTPYIAQHWVDASKIKKAVSQGAKVITSAAGNVYLDMKYDAQTPVGATWLGYTNLEKAYNWDPVNEYLSESDLLGLEAPLWTETVETQEDIDLLTFPRLCGHAEIAWSPAEQKDFANYSKRLVSFSNRLDLLGVHYYQSPELDWP